MRVVSPDELAEREHAQAIADTQPLAEASSGLASFIRRRFDEAKRHRDSASGWNIRLQSAMRAFKGEYAPEKQAEIKQFGGSDVYARVIAGKCRGATSLLRDVYLGPERAWGLEPTPEPRVQEDIPAKIGQLVMAEVGQLNASGQMVDDTVISDRVRSLAAAANKAARKMAAEQAKAAERKLDDILVEGRFYQALAEFLVDLPLFPFACLKGPVVRVVPDLRWQNRLPVVVDAPKMFWERVSPFDIWWTPGASRVENAEIFERVKLTRADLNAVLGLPGYDETAVRAVLDEYGRGGLSDWIDSSDSDRAVQESRENPITNTSGMIDSLEYHGPVQGRTLLDHGFPETMVPDPMRDYAVQAWIIGRHVIKVQLAPSPRKRHPYYITSFEKTPGTVIGNGLPDILEDIQDVANAALRSLVNNMAISSGPQVVINTDRLAPHENADDLYPWKRWHMTAEPLAAGRSEAPVNFFQPSSNAQQLLYVYEKMTQIADEVSAIPRYVTGSERMGGAGRTASGLAMLMGNASKILQTVANNVDKDVMEPALQALYDMVLLTDQGQTLVGDENIVVRGVTVALQRETERQRSLELLQVTANPVDMNILGPLGRAALLRSVATAVGHDGDELVPPEEELRAQMQQQQMLQQQMAMQQGVPPGAPPGAPPGGPAPAPGPSDGPRVNLQQQTSGM